VSTLLPLLVQIVVMTQRSKLDMEETFKRCLPQSQRCGANLVFRKGSPLLPSDLEMVAAHNAAATIVVSDQSRSADEADAQVTRYVCGGLLTSSHLRHTVCSALAGQQPEMQAIPQSITFG
jgi:hypothetical protein